MTNDELKAIYEEEVRRTTDLIVFLLRMMPLTNNLITVKLAPFYEYRESLVKNIKDLEGVISHEQLTIVSSSDRTCPAKEQPIDPHRNGHSRFSYDYRRCDQGHIEGDGNNRDREETSELVGN